MRLWLAAGLLRWPLRYQVRRLLGLPTLLTLLLATVLPGMAAGQPAQNMAVQNMVAQGTVAVYFTPWDDAEGALLRTIDRARQTIHGQAYLITSRNIARALIAAQTRGVRVMLLADRDMLLRGEHSQLPALHAAGIEVRLETRYAAAHNKILLIDAEGNHPVIVTGSYNFSYSAQARNAENLLILRDNLPLTRAYLANWQRHRDETQAFTAGVTP